jgi:hypothetical protein
VVTVGRSLTVAVLIDRDGASTNPSTITLMGHLPIGNRAKDFHACIRGRSLLKHIALGLPRAMPEIRKTAPDHHAAPGSTRYTSHISSSSSSGVAV